jgi:hypothetical protein
LEELDDLAGRLLKQDVLAGPSLSLRNWAQAADLGVEVVDDEMDAVPAAGPGLAAIRHRPASGAVRPGEQQAEVAASDVSEGRPGVGDQLEVEQIDEIHR